MTRAHFDYATAAGLVRIPARRSTSSLVRRRRGYHEAKRSCPVIRAKTKILSTFVGGIFVLYYSLFIRQDFQRIMNDEIAYADE